MLPQRLLNLLSNFVRIWTLALLAALRLPKRRNSLQPSTLACVLPLTWKCLLHFFLECAPN
jgi:hypothetical protein